MTAPARHLHAATPLHLAGETSDYDLAVAAAAGSLPAFETLARRHQDAALRLLLQRARCRADAEDALQEALIKCYRFVDRYDRRYAFRTWLFAIAHRELITLSRRKRVALRLQDVDEPATAPPPELPGGLWTHARALLPPDHYAALWLTYGEDLPGRDVARILGRSQIWVRVTLLRVRRKLRQSLPAQRGVL